MQDKPLSGAEVEATRRLEQLVGLLGLLHRVAEELTDGPAYGVAEALIAVYRRRLSYELAALENAAAEEGVSRRRR
ncbi:MAG: hypothetical protein JO023_19670 [Chloroflexi bacterium]|nr:hypothetical protein [Chloroflexota bacterium]